MRLAHDVAESLAAAVFDSLDRRGILDDLDDEDREALLDECTEAVVSAARDHEAA